MVTKYIPIPRFIAGERQGGLQYLKENEYTHKPLFTKREREVFELLVQDKTTREIAGELFISEKTVRNHISNAMRSDCKLQLTLINQHLVMEKNFIG